MLVHNEVEGKEQYHVEISNRFAALRNLDAELFINRAWERNRAEPLVPDSSAFEVETAIANLKRYKSPGSDQVPA
jgi:hypothetical protein